MPDVPALPIPDDEKWLHTFIMKRWIDDACQWPGTYETNFGFIPSPTDARAICCVFYKVLACELYALCEYAGPEIFKIAKSFEALSKLTWSQLIADDTFEWREIESVTGLHSLRLTDSSRAVCKRIGARMYFLVIDAPYSIERVEREQRSVDKMAQPPMSREEARALMKEKMNSPEFAKAKEEMKEFFRIAIPIYKHSYAGSAWYDAFDDHAWSQLIGSQMAMAKKVVAKHLAAIEVERATPSEQLALQERIRQEEIASNEHEGARDALEKALRTLRANA